MPPMLFLLGVLRDIFERSPLRILVNKLVYNFSKSLFVRENFPVKGVWTQTSSTVRNRFRRHSYRCQGATPRRTVRSLMPGTVLDTRHKEAGAKFCERNFLWRCSFARGHLICCRITTVEQLFSIAQKRGDHKSLDTTLPPSKTHTHTLAHTSFSLPLVSTRQFQPWKTPTIRRVFDVVILCLASCSVERHCCQHDSEQRQIRTLGHSVTLRQQALAP